MGFAAAFVATALAKVVGLQGWPGAIPVFGVAAVCCLWSTPRAALFVGGLAWACANGLLVNRRGRLTFDQLDLMMLLMSITIALAVCVWSGLLRVQVARPDDVARTEVDVDTDDER